MERNETLTFKVTEQEHSVINTNHKISQTIGHNKLILTCKPAQFTKVNKM